MNHLQCLVSDTIQSLHRLFANRQQKKPFLCCETKGKCNCIIVIHFFGKITIKIHY